MRREALGVRSEEVGSGQTPVGSKRREALGVRSEEVGSGQWAVAVKGISS